MVAVEGLGWTGFVGFAWVCRVWAAGFIGFGISDLGFRFHRIWDLVIRDSAYFLGVFGLG